MAEEPEYKDPWGQDDVLARGLKAFEAKKKLSAEASDEKSTTDSRNPKDSARAKRTGDNRRDKQNDKDSDKGRRERDKEDRRERRDRDRDRYRDDDRRRHIEDRHEDERHRRRDRDYDRRDSHTSRHRDDRSRHRDNRHRSDRRDRERRDRDDRYDRNRRDDKRDRHDKRARHDRHRDRASHDEDDAHRADGRDRSPTMQQEVFTAVKIIDYMLDLFSSPKLRVSAFDDCLALSTLTICALSDGSAIATGDDYKDVLASLARGWKCEPRKRLFFDNQGQDPTFVLDVYARGQSPALNLSGPVKAPVDHSVAVLYRCEGNKCTKMYVTLDAQGIAAADGMDQAAFMNTPIAKQALDIVIRPGGVSAGLSLHYHDYAKVTTIG